MQQSLRMLDHVAKQFRHQFHYQEAVVGGAAYDACGEHCPDETLNVCQQADAVLFGSVGGPIDEQHLAKWQNCESNSILKLRKSFVFNINLRPINIYPGLADISPLRTEVISQGADIAIFRELCGDIYFGKHEQSNDAKGRFAIDEAVYHEEQIKSIAHAAFKAAQQRNKTITSVDKANVLATSKLWRQVVDEVSADYPDVTLSHMLVDNCAMQLVLDPQQFNVILTANLFGDILSDLAAALPGSLGLIPSASFNADGFAMYEPSGGSAPQLTGKNVANPIAQMLSVAMMLRYSFGLQQEAQLIEDAVARTLAEGIRTQDIASAKTAVSTSAFTDAVLAHIDAVVAVV